MNNTEHNFNRFADADALWFWFVASKRIKTGFMARYAGGANRPCEILDMEVLMTRLNLSGKLPNAALNVLTRYGFLRRAPNKNLRHEEKDAAAWEGAMETITAAAKAKGWLE
ncbi:MAG: hypothetical protein LBH81_01475 [Rickettsiales bacterium]|jgi:hypothetical protein|nr:hypothetical protein [Rickettsiales bacterium]